MAARTEDNEEIGGGARDIVTRFYLSQLKGTWQDRTVYTAPCPFCSGQGRKESGKLIVFLNREGFFHGYFRCLSRCVPGGFPLWFARLAGLDPAGVPGYDPERDLLLKQVEYPIVNLNNEMKGYGDRLTDSLLNEFEEAGVSEAVLQEMHIGFNGRYITYPYIQGDGNCYSMRCVFPDRNEDFFWHGDDHFSVDPFRLFNVQDIERCENGSLFICEGEDNLLTLKQLGFPGVAVPHANSFEAIRTGQFATVHTVFIVTRNTVESEMSARTLAARLGYKVRLLRWPGGLARNYSLCQLARDKGSSFRKAVGRMIQESRSFSPFATPQFEHDRFFSRLDLQQEEEYSALRSGFPSLDAALDGIHGINVIGGAPKVGKSSFMIQMASQMAADGIPVLYYDFENGRQKVYQRILSRLSRMDVKRLGEQAKSAEEEKRYTQASGVFRKMLQCFRVINDRKVTPELMRRHIDFIRHETRSEYTVVVIDSLHKLPFKDFSERRTGIDAWLRQMESIRDEMQVSFLVISELSRGTEGAYTDQPHLGMFKGSGDIEYSADNAMVLVPAGNDAHLAEAGERRNTLWLVASREHSPGPVATYRFDYPYWGFVEE